MISSKDALDEIREIMWPAADPGKPWEAETIEYVAEAIRKTVDPLGTVEGSSPADKTVEELRKLLWPPEDPDQQWTASTIEEVAWTMEGYERSVSAAEPVAGADVETIDKHRATLGMGPIDPGGGWTADELKRMADTIRREGRMGNPVQVLKRRLMR